jgi:protein-S-isoprenylcysteine O-methyltransferase Ste14
MRLRLLLSALTKYLVGVVMVGALVMLPAGSVGYWQGWLFMATLFVPILVAGVVMLVKSPSLLESRLKAKEGQREQDVVVKLSGLLFVAAFVVAGFNWRYAWLVLPDWIVWSAAVVFILCYLLYAEVMRENAYLSRTIEIQEGQRVVDTGLYSVVRHPMYTATTLLFLAMPLVLASPISLLIMLLYIPLIVVRIIHEERYLKVNLEGYTEYTKRIRYRLIPYIW